MTKKHFIQFAKIIAQRMAEAGNDHELKMRAQAMADMVILVASADNPRFDRARFSKACGL